MRFLAWLVVIGRMNTGGFVERRWPYMCFSPHWCILCRSEAENADQVFLHCQYSLNLLWKLFREVGACWVIPKGYFELTGTCYQALGKETKAKLGVGKFVQFEII